MNVRVKPKHIKKGLKGSARSCPIALALLDATGKEYTVNSVTAADSSTYTVKNHNGSKFVHDFDSGFAVKPFTLVLE